jgi:Polysaccharide lyase
MSQKNPFLRAARYLAPLTVLACATTLLIGPSADADPVDTVGLPISSTDMATLGWVAKEQPRIGSITTLPASFVLDDTPTTGPLMRVELRPGETYTAPGGKPVARAEVLGRIPKDRTLPASLWADPPESERWYSFKVFFPEGFPVAADTRWLMFTQWKGLQGGSPPLALEVKRSGLRLGGTRTNAFQVPNDGDLGPISFGHWTRLTVGVHWSTDSSLGWVTVYRDGVEVLARTPVSTMDTVDGAADPVYLKQGLYRSAAWTQTQFLYLSPMQVTSTRPS